MIKNIVISLAVIFMLLGVGTAAAKTWYYIKVIRTMDHILQNSHVYPTW
jgi:hypothetical protein